MSFLTEYFNIPDGTGETAVCCPFDHYTSGNVPYKETNPSAHVNTLENLFHCKVCGTGYNEAQLIQKLYDCSYINAKRIQRCFNSPEDVQEWNNSTKLTEESKALGIRLGISEDVLTKLNVKTPYSETSTLAFPVFLHGHLLDVRKYNPELEPKIRSRSNCPAGLIIPYDIWSQTSPTRITLICAGEKDMAVARSQGFNAITITGGENCAPIIKSCFKNRYVAICYDNDMAGIRGAKRLAMELLKYTPNVKVVTNFHQVCKEEKEDITDFFTKYNKTKLDLIEFLNNTPTYIPTEEDLKAIYPTVTLQEAAQPNKVGRMVQSNIQVVSVAEASYICPAAIVAEKTKTFGDNDTMYLNEFREWELCEDNAKDIMHLIDNNFNETTIDKNIRGLLKIPQKERYVKIKTVASQTVYKVFVTDLFETSDTTTQPMEFTAYAVGCKMESGQKYLVTYKLIPHPYKGQQLTMLILEAVQANDSVSNFIVTDEVKQNLDVIRTMEGSVDERVTALTEKVKGLLGYNGNNTLIQAIDLAYHTVLQFNFGNFKNVRGYLDTIVVGESRVGKSSTADTLRKVYGLGTFTSLAGNSATIPGLVGGSNKTSAGFQTRAGIIPQNHKGLIIFEEFGKCNANITSELTDIRSSNEVRITRVSGTITLPAMVRMIALTNVKNTSSGIKPIASYPNGISIVTELVDTAEDIARYDLIVVLSDRGNNQIDPFWTPQSPLAEEVYRTRVRWVWSRTSEQVKIDNDVGLYIIQKANELNAQYECHIKIFGTEAWKKIARLAIAVAGYLVSTDESYMNVVVKKEHVDFAIAYFIKIYDNATFKLREYVQHEKRYSTVDAEAVALLQDIYTKVPSLVLQLEQTAAATKNMLGAATGLGNDDLNKALNRLTKGLFIRFANHDIIPTERFRLGLAEINKDTVVRRVGE